MDLRTYIDLEQALAGRLSDDWTKEASKVYAGLVPLVQQERFAEARDKAREVSFSQIADKNRPYIRYVLRACVGFGGGLVAPKPFVSSLAFDATLDGIVDGFVATLEYNAKDYVYRKLLQLIAEAEKELVEKANPYHDEKGLFTTKDKAVGGVTFYHGTVDSVLESILKNGLIPKGGTGGDEWAKKHGWNQIVTEINKRPSSVFLAVSEKDALSYADKVKELHPGSSAVLLRVVVPENIRSKFVGDELDQGNFRFEGVIRPEWIKQSSVMKTEFTFWLVIPVLDKQEVKKAPKQRFIQDFVSFKESGDQMLQLVSSLHTSRLSTWGFTAEAEVRGVTEYQLTAVLDGRTSDFCRMINGRRFKVEDARRSITGILEAGPENAKTLQPWPRQSKMDIEEWSSLSDEEIVARNWHIPPFHPGCRTMLTMVGKAPRKVPKQPVAQNYAVQSAQPQEFKDVGAWMSPKQIEFWNEYVGVAPAEVLSLLSGKSPMEILGGVLAGKYNPITLSKRGIVGLKAKGVYDEGFFDLRMNYDPYTGTLAKTYVELGGLSKEKAGEFLTRLYKDMATMGEVVGANKLLMATAGSSAYAYATMGVVPSPVEWGNLRRSMLSDLHLGGKYFVEFEKLPVSDRSVVLSLLNSNSEDSLMVLAKSKIKLGGENIAKVLLEGKTYEAYLDLADPAKVQMFKEMLQ